MPLIEGESGANVYAQQQLGAVQEALQTTQRLTPQQCAAAPAKPFDGMICKAMAPWRPLANQTEDQWVTYDGATSSWKHVGPQPASTTPAMNGTAAVGTSDTYAHADHVHPTDTSRAPLANPTFTGTVTLGNLTVTGAISGYATQSWCNSTFKAIGAYTPNQSVDTNANPTFWNTTVGGTLSATNSGATHQFSAVTASGNLVGGYVRSTGSMMCDSGTFYVANNLNYYLARNGTDGAWRFVENGTTNCTIDAGGSLTTRTNISSGGQIWSGSDVIARTTVYIAYNSNSSHFITSNGSGQYWNYNSGGWKLYWSISNGDLLFYQSDGNWRWWSAADGFHIMGNCFAANVSDERCKKNIQPYKRGLRDLVNLKPISFQYNGQGTSCDSGRVHHGLSAQHSRGFIPECVAETELGPVDPTQPDAKDHRLPGQLSLDPAPLTFALINAVKELNDRVTALETQVKQLQAKLP
jgi:hypothetical protein